MMSYKEHFDLIKKVLFDSLNSNENLTLTLEAEESEFVRLNATKVRQVSNIEQCSLFIQLSKGSRHTSVTLEAPKNLDLSQLDSALNDLRLDLNYTIEDEFFSFDESDENSTEKNLAPLISSKDFLKHLGEYKEFDLAGYLAIGNLYRGLASSSGMNHWFETSNFNFDYSFYSEKQKAVKGNYAGSSFDPDKFHKKIKQSLNSLEQLGKQAKVVSSGKYRVYLAPKATAEIMNFLAWGSFSRKALEMGHSPLKQLVNNEKSLSSKVTIIENFELGLAPKFNDKGRLKPTQLDLIFEGKLNHLLVSSETAKEFKLESNQANKSEQPASLSMKTGKLSQEQIFTAIGTGFYLSNLHYLNWSDLQKGRLTGMTRFGCLWVEDGEVVGPIKDMRFDESIYQIFGQGLEECSDFSEVFMETHTYGSRMLGGVQVPGLLVNDFTFTL